MRLNLLTGSRSYRICKNQSGHNLIRINMADIEKQLQKFIKVGGEMGFHGEELRKWADKQLEDERIAKREEREARREEIREQAELAEKQIELVL
ncbi:hypothetical protein ElyMa_000642500 [Elysia marginata]|uniref:Uncharacterized protein n=1 Tax=Elysia marginata TaxID=1093978 RepID=A0AAV4GC42_9GAST|nr:hypothetical protein ElyMa_000642500 [Elysia marginata]